MLASLLLSLAGLASATDPILWHYDPNVWRHEHLIDPVPSTIKKAYLDANHRCSDGGCLTTHIEGGEFNVNDLIHRKNFEDKWDVRMNAIFGIRTRNLKENSVIFVDGSVLWKFLYMHTIRIKVNFILVVHHPHISTPEGCNVLTGECLPPLVREISMLERCTHIFGPNWVTEKGNNKIIGIPSGVSDTVYDSRDEFMQLIQCATPYGSSKRRHQILVPLVIGRAYSSLWKWLQKSSLPSSFFYLQNTGRFQTELVKSRFVVIKALPDEDPTLLWEAIYAGCIPILLRARCANPLYRDIPKVFVEDWDRLDQEQLNAAVDKFNSAKAASNFNVSYVCHKRSACTEEPLCVPRIATSAHWVRTVNAVRSRQPEASRPFFDPNSSSSRIPQGLLKLEDANLIYFYKHTIDEMQLHYWWNMNFTGLPPYVCQALEHLACVGTPGVHQSLKPGVEYGNINVFFVTNHPDSVNACLRRISVPSTMKFIVISTHNERNTRLFNSAQLESFRKTRLYTAWEGLWRFAMERFFYVERLMAKYYLKNVLLVETDNLMYMHPSLLVTAMKYRYGSATVGAPQRDVTSISGVLYVGSFAAMQRLCQFLLRWTQTDFEGGLQFIGDDDIYSSGEMVALRMYQFIHGPRHFPHFPVVPSGLWVHTHLYDNVPVLDLSELWDCKDSSRSCACVIFDDASYGIFLGGTPNAENPGTIIEGHAAGPHLRDHHILVSWDIGACVPGAICGPAVHRMPPMQYQRCLLANVHVHKKHVMEIFMSPLCPKSQVPDAR